MGILVNPQLAYGPRSSVLCLEICCNNALCIMNTSFQHRDVHKYTQCKDSLGQWSLTDFCIVSAHLFCSLLDVHVQRGTQLSSDHHLLVCNLHLEKLPGPTNMQDWEILPNKVGGPGEETCKKDVCRQHIVYFLRSLECTVDVEIVVVVRSSFCFICCSHMRTRKKSVW